MFDQCNGNLNFFKQKNCPAGTPCMHLFMHVFMTGLLKKHVPVENVETFFPANVQVSKPRFL